VKKEVDNLMMKKRRDKVLKIRKWDQKIKVVIDNLK
jgi:hypothetical protein